MKCQVTPYALDLIHPFTISRGTMTQSHVFLVELEGGGLGECSPVRYYKQTPEEGMELVPKMAEGLTAENLFDLDYHLSRAREIAPKHSPPLAALDIALHDRIGKETGLPLYKLFGYGEPKNACSTYTIGLDTDEAMVAKTLEAESYPQLKIKLGRDARTDLQTMRAIREAAPNKEIRIDANAGWTLDEAIKFARHAEELGLEFIEQPLAIGNLEELGKFRQECPVPVVADEDVQNLSSLHALVGKIDGINIKLMKTGGLWEARQMIGFARAEGWSVMLGCMIESGVAIAAASHLAGAAADLDLDSEALISNNPVEPQVLQPDGQLKLTGKPGLGLGLKEG